MPDEVLDQLRPGPGDVVIDATTGCGGHACLLWEAMQGRGTLIAIDRDPEMIEIAQRRFRQQGIESESVRWVVGSFADLAEHLADQGIQRFDCVLFDFGINSVQLDDPSRGFAFATGGPLDARFNRREPIPTLAERLARIDVRELEETIRRFGDERWARRIARAIVRKRESEPIETTEALARIVRSAVRSPAGRGRIDRATRTFQALRILVNDELRHLEQGLEQAIEGLEIGGRIVCLSYHSGEDRLVKGTFRRHDARFRKRDLEDEEKREVLLDVLTKKPRRAGEAECRQNRRARSARLRAAVRIQ